MRNVIYILGYNRSVGQNLAWGSHLTWNGAIQGWFDEVKDFVFGVGKRDQKPGESYAKYVELAVGHYTQVIKFRYFY